MSENYITSIVDEDNDIEYEIRDLEAREDISELKSAIESFDGSLTADVKQALLALFRNVAYTSNRGQALYDDLYNALYAITAISLSSNSLTLNSIGATSQLTATTTPEGGAVTWSSSNDAVATVDETGLVTSVSYGSATITASAGSVSASCSVVVATATVTSISAVYTQSGTVYDSDSLDSLKSDLVVTASWSDSTTSTVSANDYTLTGTLTEGTSTITVSYGGKTTTFTVIVEHYTVHYDGLYTPQNVITGEYIDENGDAVAATEDSGYYEEYLPADSGAYIDVRYTSDDVNYNLNFRVSIYDSSKTFVRQIQTRGKGEMFFHLENDESYFRLGYYSVGGNPQFYLYDAEAMPMEIGDVSASTGEEVEQAKRIRSDFIPVGNNPVAQGCPFATSWPTNYVYAWRCFDENYGYLSNVSVLNTTNPTLPSGTAYIRAVMQYSNASHTFTTGWSSEVIYAIRIGDNYYVLTEAE